MLQTIVSTECMTHEQWLQWRTKGIGGSDASIICGINKYKSAMQLWLEKTGRIEPEEAGEPAYWGSVLEPIIREEFAKRTRLHVHIVKAILQHPEHPFMLANLDGVIEDPEHGNCIFEAKTASVYLADQWEDTIPEVYMLQIQHYMAVTDFTGAYIAVLIGGNQFKWQYIPRDDELIAMLIELESDFWQHVENNTPPPIDGSEAATVLLNRMYPNGSPTQITLPDEAEQLITEFELYQEREKEMVLLKDKAANQLKSMLGNNECGIVGERSVLWKNISLNRLDGTRLKQAHPYIYSSFLNTSSYRRFSVK